jgi:hypothetical protein
MIFFRLVGRAFRRVVAMVLFALIRGRRVLIPAVVLLAVAWFAVPALLRQAPAGTLPAPLSGLIAPGGSSSATTAPARGANASAPATKMGGMNAEAVPSVDSYIKGLTQFDAKLMWGSLSEEAIQAMRSRGGSLEALQKGLDDARQRGARYEDITMIGNYPLQDGRKYLFYVLSRRGFTGPEQLEQVYFVFTVAKDGKITRIE